MATLQVSDPGSVLDFEKLGEAMQGLPVSVQLFCLEQNLLGHLQTALRLAKECFQPISLRTRAEQDPDSGERWLVVAITVRKGTVPIREAYRRYTIQWAALVPYPALHQIRISYDLV